MLYSAFLDFIQMNAHWLICRGRFPSSIDKQQGSACVWRAPVAMQSPQPILWSKLQLPKNLAPGDGVSQPILTGAWNFKTSYEAVGP